LGKKKKKLPHKKVSDLPVGKGTIIIKTKRGKEIEVDGKAIKLSDGRKHLRSKGNNRNSVRLSFGPGTEVLDIKEWRPKIETSAMENEKMR
jgi:hypothetical protein